MQEGGTERGRVLWECGTTSAGQVTHGVTEEKLKKSKASDLRNIHIRRKPQSNVFSMEASPSHQSSRSTSELHGPTPNPKHHTTTYGGNNSTASDWTGRSGSGTRPTLGPNASICSICTYLIGVFVWVQFGVAAYHQCLSVPQSDSIESRNRSRVPSSPSQKENVATEELLWPGQTSQHRLFCSL